GLIFEINNNRGRPCMEFSTNKLKKAPLLKRTSVFFLKMRNAPSYHPKPWPIDPFLKQLIIWFAALFLVFACLTLLGISFFHHCFFHGQHHLS
ncbi:MAG: hypothetical protein Q8P67_15985, partial [archaeon]|nr:hypothetical protein [archaeon]